MDNKDYWLDDFWLEKEEEENWNVDYFLQSNYINLENISIRKLSYKLSYLAKAKKQLVLKDIRIQNYFKEALLKGKNNWQSCNEIFENIDFIDLKDIFDEEFISKLFIKTEANQDYKLLASAFMKSKDINEVITIIINNDYLFNVFKQRYQYIYSAVDLDNEHLYLLIKKISDTNTFSFFNSMYIYEENAKFIINQDYSIQTLMWLIDKMPNNIIEEFYLNDNRAELTLPYLKNIDSYLEKGIKFGNKVIKNPNFFELLKSDSLMDFRKRINDIEDNCDDPNFIEEKRKRYYDELINSYNQETNLFKIYEQRLNNPDLELEQLPPPIDSYIMNPIVQYECFLDKEKYIEQTNLKLSEIIVDALFQDNIYNVWINIKELLHYDNYLETFEKIITKENLEFYKLILEIDKCPCNEKIKLYHSLKDNNINLLFYEDIRKTKNIAYQKIKDKIISPTTYLEYENKEETNKNGVVTYDFRNKDFYMLIRTLNDTYKENKTLRSGSSYSIISNDNTSIFGNYEDKIIYGYNSFDIDKIEHMFESDSFSSSFSRQRGNTINSTFYPNRLATIEEIANSGGYSEVILKNEKHKNNKYQETKPDFIVAIDKVDERIIEASQKLNLPIVIIDQKNNGKGIKFSQDITQTYVEGSFLEEQRINRR